MSARRLATQLVHAGAERIEGAVVPPIFQSANYLQEDVPDYGSIRYMRMSNAPTHRMLSAKMAAIEGGEAALPFSSGMAAISTTLLALLETGDHLLVQDNVYGGTATFVHEDLARLGVRATRIDARKPSEWAAALTPTTRAIYVESVSNPLIAVPDLRSVVDFASRRGLTSIVDNTFQSPVGFRPLPFGFDLVLHSATKYLGGHSDLAAGMVAGSTALVQRVHHQQNHLGGCLDAHACFLLDRGMKTLALRVPHQAATAHRLATFLDGHPAVARVRYPGLPHDPGHDYATAWFDHYGAMLAFETDSVRRAESFLERVQIPLHAASLGGVESLVVRPSRSSHLGMDPAEREALGITDRLIRVSVGIEDVDDLLEDFVQSLG